MFEVFTNHIDDILKAYSEGEKIQYLKDAKQSYIELTGKLDEDTSEYETRMNTFNDWFIFHYKGNEEKTIFESYVKDNKMPREAVEVFEKINFSLFHFIKISFRGKLVIKDIVSGEKFLLDRKLCDLALLEDDLFLGRMISFNDNHYLLKGVCTIPKEVLGILKKEIKKIKKKKIEKTIYDFLLQVEKCKTKSLSYSHLNLDKIYLF